MNQVVLSATGLYNPPESISNEELVVSFNAYVDRYNAAHADEIAAGQKAPLSHSNAEFITKASGIESRYVVDKAGILDPDVMHPQIRTRGNDEPSIQCEMALAAIDDCLKSAGRRADEVDAILVACSNLPRPYPALAVEVQEYLGGGAFGFDLNVACASAAFGIQTGADMIRAGTARRVLMVNPEICTAHLNFRDRDSHFIFGDVCTAALLEHADDVRPGQGFDVLGTHLQTKFSNNIRNNFGFLNRSETETRSDADRLFVQNGRRVFKDVGPMVAEMIIDHLAEHGLAAEDVRRLWLHQANINMNTLIAKRVLGRSAESHELPGVFAEYGNTSSASPVIVLHKYAADLAAGEIGVMAGFGAGYSAGSVILKRR
ncbi:beta-ketoacyl-ACP synthase III [Salinisphaera japonica]|uniref:3-oxoacyl-ACP synthase n=1 Tax=Salinisphaera japonica YTM-1 TaxID=1209778 RepID=A0A423Q2A6_9GAMM|nr:beta-ketoacyl-ACP synthase III [Salinisphaera japonica]ROO32725.1 3-oxoacyl-ACP synthase [Salinisphaera japonica YTM-1]